MGLRVIADQIDKEPYPGLTVSSDTICNYTLIITII